MVSMVTEAKISSFVCLARSMACLKKGKRSVLSSQKAGAGSIIIGGVLGVVAVGTLRLDDRIKATRVEWVAPAYPGTRFEESFDQVKTTKTF